MEREFVMTLAFDETWKQCGLGDEDLRKLQEELLLDPSKGDVIPKSGGARKVRVPLKGRGKRGGGRVIYVDVVVGQRIYLLMAYPKNELSTLTAEQLRKMRRVIVQLRKEPKDE
ncbi:MAG TPA: type II toxin-antitoxin system RelE/ParE family toxin [Clostridiaceae bacterium]|nr:type II toxin-antitoxin system RelE/ParE family toxin [Clostridiaceae bacterium]